MALSWDIARCTGANDAGVCQARQTCRRFIELDYTGPFTMLVEAPIDAPLGEACELLIEDNATDDAGLTDAKKPEAI